MLEYIKSKRLTIGEVLSIAANIYKQNNDKEKADAASCRIPALSNTATAFEI